ncbi:fas-binding factor 1 [Euwallacea fornicatus]|uniref:fas-binding factor 1 n=1 Tax=Euwallacea fornicatus TaxID=995702 RepID=UPI00338F7D3F
MDLDHDFESDDSFFDDPKLGKKLQTKTSDKKSLEDLFGFEDEGKKTVPSSQEASKPKVHFDLESEKAKATPDWLNSGPEKTAVNLDEILPNPAKTESKKPLDLFDDILPPKGGRRLQPSKAASFEDILKESKAAAPDQKNTVSANKPEASFARRGRRGSNTAVTDVLGLFSSPSPSSTEHLANTSTKQSSTRDWLMGETNPETPITAQPKKNEAISKPINEPPQEKITTLPLATENSQFQTNISNLQAQESFLLVSLQLKKYEESLSEIRNQQHEILQKQEQQFELFLSKYIEKQKGIEQEVLVQQERINEHIRNLALQGSSKSGVSRGEQQRTEDGSLDRVVKALKQRHEEEFFLMEESYKKQLNLLEKSADSMEQRLSEEIAAASKLHEDKLANLKSQHIEEIKFYTDKLSNLDLQHKEEIDVFKQHQSILIADIKNEFLDKLERLNEQRTRENELFSGSADLSQKLSFSLDKLDRNEEILGQLRDKVVKDYDILSLARERSIENKERDVNAMRVALEKCRDQAETDRSQLISLVKTLEQKLAEQSRNCQEERWALQQAAATIAARTAAFEREIEFSRSSIEREREQLKTLKESLLAEQEKITLQLTEEKLQLSAEKSRLQVTAKLVNNYEVEKIKTEAQTAAQVARELIEKLNLERSFVQKQKVDLETFRNKLMEKERDLIEREETLEESRRVLQHKSNEDKRLTQEAKYLENRYKEKLQELQAQAMSLANREKKLAEEKLLLSKERLVLYTSGKLHSNCVLCTAENQKLTVKNEGFSKNSYSSPYPHIIELPVFLDEDELNSEVSKQ